MAGDRWTHDFSVSTSFNDGISPARVSMSYASNVIISKPRTFGDLTEQAGGESGKKWQSEPRHGEEDCPTPRTGRHREGMGLVGVSRASFGVSSTLQARCLSFLLPFRTPRQAGIKNSGVSNDGNSQRQRWRAPGCNQLPQLSRTYCRIIHHCVNMLKLNSVIARPSLVRTASTSTPSGRRISSATGKDSPSSPSSIGVHTLSSGDTIPSVGLGTWRASGEDVGKAVKVCSVDFFQEMEP